MNAARSALSILFLNPWEDTLMLTMTKRSAVLGAIAAIAMSATAFAADL